MYSSWTKIENPTKKDLLHGLLGTKEKSRKIAYLRFKNSKLPQAVVSKQRVDRWRILMIGDAFWTIRCRGRKPLQKVPIVLSSSLKGEVLFQSAVHEANNRTRRVDACFFLSGCQGLSTREEKMGLPLNWVYRRIAKIEWKTDELKGLPEQELNIVDMLFCGCRTAFGSHRSSFRFRHWKYEKLQLKKSYAIENDTH